MEGEGAADTETGDELPVLEEVSPEELLKEKEEQEEKEKEKQKRLENVEIKKGDYQVHVHVIEVRDLKCEDLEGTSDPVAHVYVFGETQHTKVMKKRTSCVFDDVFFFKASEMTPDRLETEVIKVSVFDADTFSRNDLIGSFQFDAVDVYYRENHELHEQWVGLTDEKSATDNGIQGYLKLSICVLGPGDKKKVHSDSEKKGSGDITDIASMVMMPPTVKQVSTGTLAPAPAKGVVHTPAPTPPLTRPTRRRVRRRCTSWWSPCCAPRASPSWTRALLAARASTPSCGWTSVATPRSRRAR